MATDKTGLGDRMKMYERREAGRSLMPGLPVCVRIDGKRFSRWTDGLARPYDQRLSDLMIETTMALVEETNACIGYTQSDEISLVLYDDDPKAKPYLGARLQKLCSILASVATAQFNARVPTALPERAAMPALFDCRVWAVPNKQ
ncbi:MAG: tRNA(His) guanylyltransferase Thg1 family protein [Myxococcales bacterium]|nr:tRNA(His) guanylyltransferase Thg1 family protein [Myxococcales bacterium]